MELDANYVLGSPRKLNGADIRTGVHRMLSVPLSVNGYDAVQLLRIGIDSLQGLEQIKVVIDSRVIDVFICTNFKPMGQSYESTNSGF